MPQIGPLGVGKAGNSRVPPSASQRTTAVRPGSPERCEGHPESFNDLCRLKAGDRTLRCKGDERRHGDRRNTGAQGTDRREPAEQSAAVSGVDSDFFRGFSHSEIQQGGVLLLRPASGKCQMPRPRIPRPLRTLDDEDLGRIVRCVAARTPACRAQEERNRRVGDALFRGRHLRQTDRVEPRRYPLKEYFEREIQNHYAASTRR